MSVLRTIVSEMNLEQIKQWISGQAATITDAFMKSKGGANTPSKYAVDYLNAYEEIYLAVYSTYHDIIRDRELEKMNRDEQERYNNLDSQQRAKVDQAKEIVDKLFR